MVGETFASTPAVFDVLTCRNSASYATGANFVSDELEAERWCRSYDRSAFPVWKEILLWLGQLRFVNFDLVQQGTG